MVHIKTQLYFQRMLLSALEVPAVKARACGLLLLWEGETKVELLPRLKLQPCWTCFARGTQTICLSKKVSLRQDLLTLMYSNSTD